MTDPEGFGGSAYMGIPIVFDTDPPKHDGIMTFFDPNEPQVRALLKRIARLKGSRSSMTDKAPIHWLARAMSQPRCRGVNHAWLMSFAGDESCRWCDALKPRVARG